MHSQGRKDECLKVLSNVAKFNNIEEEWNIYQQNNDEIIGLIGFNKESNNFNQKKNENIGFFKILKIQSQKYKFICTLIVWTLTGVCFYGIILYLNQMKGNFFINAILSFFGELIAELIGGKLMDIYGRKSITIYLYWNIFFSFI